MALQTATKAKTAAPKVAKPAPAAPKKAAPITAKKAVSKKAADNTVTLKTVFAQIATEHEMPHRLAYAIVAGMVDRVTAILKSGGRVRLSGLGTIEVRDRAARMGRNPATGAAIQIAASRKIVFRAAKELKAAI